LQYIEEDGQRLKLWLCRRCHLRGVQAAAKLVNGYQHIERHLFSKHQINVTITKEAPEPISNPWDASFIAGAARASRSWLGEEALVGALIDWSIIQDQSFRAVVSAETRALLSWNRVELLKALPTSHTTLSTWIQRAVVQRKEEIRSILNLSASKIALSVDIWTSTNYLS